MVVDNQESGGSVIGKVACWVAFILSLIGLATIWIGSPAPLLAKALVAAYPACLALSLGACLYCFRSRALLLRLGAAIGIGAAIAALLSISIAVAATIFDRSDSTLLPPFVVFATFPPLYLWSATAAFLRKAD